MSWFLKNQFWKDTSQNNCPGAQNSLAITFHLLTKEISYKKYEEKKKEERVIQRSLEPISNRD